jgi:uracil-DNA glycosylase family 4
MVDTNPAPARDAHESLKIIAHEVRNCLKCDLSATRTVAVPGSGSATAEIMFVGEGPGWHEDQQGLPFVGNAGKYLDFLLSRAGLERSDVFITNVVKCRPPGNRDPLPDEIAACSEYLDRQLATIDPLLVVTLGRFSMARWFPGAKISRIHGQEKQFDRLTVVPMYHPAAALRASAVKLELEADFARLPEIVEQARVYRRRKQVQPEPDPPALDQMKLF